MCWFVIQCGERFPGGLFNHIAELWDWEPETDVEKVTYDVLRRFIHMSPRVFMRRVRNTIIEQITKIKDDAYQQGKADAVKAIQDL